MKSIGMVLSGGGVRGMAHVGLLEVLNENGIEISCLAGSSAGALVSALYAQGLRAMEIVDAFESVPLFSIYNYTWMKPGLIDTLRLRGFVQQHLPVNDFASLDIPVYIITTNLYTGEEGVHHQGELYRPLLASMSLPPYFSPVRIGKDLHADGGIVDNFPLKAIQNQCDFTIGSHVCPLNITDKSYLNSAYNVWWRAYELNFYANTKKVLHKVDFLFEPTGIGLIGTMDTKSIRKAYQLGRTHAEENIAALIKKLEAKETSILQ